MTMSATPQTSDEVREALAHALQLDLIGPGHEGEHAEERLPGWERPSMWYLTGFLVPTGTPAAQRSDDEEEDDFDAEIPEKLGLAEETVQHGKRAKRGFFPSSMGLSFLVQPDARAVRVTVTWGDYRRATGRDWAGKEVDAWAREPRAETVEVELGSDGPYRTRSVPGFGGLVLHIVERPIPTEGLGGQISPGTRAVSVFLVNERPVARNSKDADQTYAFQAQLSVECDRPFHPRPDLSRPRTPDWTTRWRAFTTPTRQPSPRVMECRRTGRSRTVNAGGCARFGSGLRRSKRPSLGVMSARSCPCAASATCRTERPLLGRRCCRWSRSTGAGSRPVVTRPPPSRKNIAPPPKDSCTRPVTLPTAWSRAWACW